MLQTLNTDPDRHAVCCDSRNSDHEHTSKLIRRQCFDLLQNENAADGQEQTNTSPALYRSGKAILESQYHESASCVDLLLKGRLSGRSIETFSTGRAQIDRRTMSAGFPNRRQRRRSLDPRAIGILDWWVWMLENATN